MRLEAELISEWLVANEFIYSWKMEDIHRPTSAEGLWQTGA
jgi:hypothetical protein